MLLETQHLSRVLSAKVTLEACNYGKIFFFALTKTQGTRLKYWKRVHVGFNATLHHWKELKDLMLVYVVPFKALG